MFHAEEEKNPWEDASRNPAPAVLSLLEDNPFGPFEEMFFEQTLRWEPYDRARLLEYVSENTEAGVDVRAHRPVYREASVSRHPSANGVTLRVNPAYVSSPAELTRALEYLERWRHALPRFTKGGATADRRPSEFFLNRGLRPLPPCFGSYLGWYTLMSPRAYEPYFDPEDLRRAPAHRVEGRDDGTIALTAYADPFDFESAETTRRIVELTQYLNGRRKDARGRS